MLRPQATAPPPPPASSFMSLSLVFSRVGDADGDKTLRCSLLPPHNNETAGTGFIGIKPTTKKEHMVRAVLESIAYRTVLCYELLKKERNSKYHSIHIDGGVSNSNFICQLIADLSGLPIIRLESSEISVLGVAYLSGLKCGFWESKEDLMNLKKLHDVFKPTKDKNIIEMYNKNLKSWMAAVKRFYSWY